MIDFGSAIFWIAIAVGLAVPVFALFSSPYRDEDIPMFFVAGWLLALVLGTHFLVKDVPPIELSPLAWLAGGVGYLLIGLSWAALRWYQTMTNIREALADRDRSTLTQVVQRYGFRSYPPTPRQCPRLIGSRIAYWPFLIVGEASALFTWVGQLFDFIFNAITRATLKDEIPSLP